MDELDVVLLDLDGTLVDAHDVIVEGVLELAAETGLGSPDAAWVRGRIGQPPASTWELLGAADPEAMVGMFSERVLPRLPERTRLIDGVAEGLAALREAGKTLAVATTRLTESALRSLEVTGLAGHIAHVTGRDLVAQSKPAPDVILHALDAVGATAERALMIGDTEADVAAAHAAGVPCWGVLTGVADEETLRAAGADHILSDGLGGVTRALQVTAPRLRSHAP